MKTARPRPEKGPPRLRAGRRQLLVYVRPDLVKETKRIALELDMTASAAVEEALEEWVVKRAKKVAKARR